MRLEDHIPLKQLEDCLAMAAYAIQTFGPNYEIHFRALELAVKEARENNTSEKAKAFLDNYTREGGLNAIFAKMSRVNSNG